MHTAEIFWSGRSQAVRLPKEFRFEGDEVRIRRHGNAVILEPIAHGWASLDQIIGPVDDDFARAASEQHQPQDFGIPAIVAHELYYGAYKGQRSADNVARVGALRFEVLDFDREDARQAGELRAHLAAAGTTIGPYDVLIAGQAPAREMTLLTHDTREFQRVPGLRIEDWE